MIRIDTSVYIVAAALIILLPLQWLLSAALATLIHEIGHLVMIRILGGHVYGIRVGACGARIYTCISGNWKEFLCAAAGPIASFSLLSICHLAPGIALAGLVQGLFNLFPVYPMDGGRMLLCFLNSLCPTVAKRLSQAVNAVVLTGILAAIGIVWIRRCGLRMPWMLCVALIVKLLSGKIPCKIRGKAVQ